MDVKGLSELLKSNIDKFMEIDNVKLILSMNNNMFKFDAVNRILIYSQHKDILDLRTADEWELLGREVVREEKPVYTIIPEYSSQYILGDTGEETDISDLSPGEKVKALELGIIHRVDIINRIKEIATYDIKQTRRVNKQSEFKVSKPVLNTNNLLTLFSRLTGGSVEQCDEFYYSESANTLYIQKDNYQNLAEMIAKALCSFYSAKYEVDKKEYKQYIVYSITTLFRGCTSRIKIVRPNDLNEYIQILSIIDEIIEKIVNEIEFSNSENNVLNADRTVNMLRKAKVILDILDANSINKKLVNSS